jgi:hypothetical protein
MDKLSCLIQNPSLAITIVAVILAIKDFGIYPTTQQVSELIEKKAASKESVQNMAVDIHDIKTLLIEHIKTK